MPISKSFYTRTTILALLVGLAALLVIVGVTVGLVRQTALYAELATTAREQRAAFADLRNTLDDAETGQRGYLLTGDETYLEPYLNAEKRLASELDQIRSVTMRDPQMADLARQLHPVVHNKMAELSRTVELYRIGKRGDALAVVRSNEGKQLMDSARTLLGQLLNLSEDKSTETTRDQQDSISTLQRVTIGSALVIIFVVGGSVWSVALYTRQLVHAQQELAALNLGLEERVRERTAELGRANEEIQRFAYIVTHDLRAPLVNIMGFTSELEAGLGSIQAFMRLPQSEMARSAVEEAHQVALEDMPEAIGFVRSSTRKMDGLINAILKLAREGRRVLKPEPVGLDAILRLAAENVQHQLSEAEGKIEFEARAITIISDRLALEQVFGNLLDNAVKYRAVDRPLLVRIRVSDARGSRVLVEVEDNGRGIAAEDHERVFDLFRRSGAQDRPGEGVGLAYVRTIVRNLGGMITLQSELNRGTTIKLSLPRDLRAVMSAQAGAAT